MRTRRAKHTARWWRSHIDSWQKSGVGQREYCEIHGLALSTFQLWRRRLKVQTADLPASVDIVPVPWAILEHPSATEPAAAAVVSASIVLLVLNGRYRLEVSDGVTGSTLRTVLDALEMRS